MMIDFNLATCAGLSSRAMTDFWAIGDKYIVRIALLTTRRIRDTRHITLASCRWTDLIFSCGGTL